MEIYIKIIEAIVETFGMFAIGAALRHYGLLRHEDLSRLSQIVLDLLFPLLIFSSLVTKLDVNRMKEYWTLPLIGFGLMAFGAILGFGLRYGMRKRNRGRWQTFMHFCAVNNYTFLPLIVIQNLWGSNYLPLLFILNVGSTVALWTIGILLLSGDGVNRKTLKYIFNPNIIAVLLGLLVAILHIPLPSLAIKISSNAGAAAMPMVLLLIGAALYGSAKQLLAYKWDISWLCICRLIIIPILTIVILKYLPLPSDVYRVSFVVAIMPVSVSASVLTMRYGGSTEFAGQAAVVTTLASIVTMPLMLTLL